MRTEARFALSWPAMGHYEIDGHTIETTSTERVLFPDCGFTKGDLIAYYHDVADAAVPHLRGRPLTMERYPRGITAKGFYNKHVPGHFPPWIKRATPPAKKPVTYPVCNEPAALVYIANQGAVTLHVWTSRHDQPDHPDLLVFDLDPPAGRFDLVRDAARALRALMDELALPAFVKTSGSKGLHVVVPLDRTASYEQVAAFAEAAGGLVCARDPDRFTLAFYKNERGGRLFIDTLRNHYTQTIVAPYTVRARPGAPVSMPIDWDELDDPALAGDRYRAPQVIERLSHGGDPWRDLYGHAAALPDLDAMPSR